MKENNHLIKPKRKIYNQENIDKIRIYMRKHLRENPEVKIRQVLSSRLRLELRGEAKTIKTMDLLGCDIIEFKQFISNKFLPEISWDNWGPVWELNHILPCASFRLVDEEEQKKCFHYTNYQPLFKTTEIAESFGYVGYIGNRNKYKNII